MTALPELGASPPPAPCRTVVRRPIALFMSRFPSVTETFILREMEELERQGQPIVAVPLLREAPKVVHPEARPWMERALYTPWLSPGIVAANLRALGHRPGRYLAVLGRLAAGTACSPSFLYKSLVLFPKSVYLAERLAGAGIAHLHAHFATHPTTAAWIVHRLTGTPYSFTVHAHDLFVCRAMLGEKIRRARFVRVISRFNRDFLAERYPAARGKKVEVIHVGVDPGRYRLAEEPAVAVDEKTPVLLTVAALKPYKGLPVLLEACAELVRTGTRLRCEVIGEGPLRRRLEGEIAARRLDGVVRLLGACTQDEVARRLLRATAVVLPSVVAPDGQMEGIPVALMEAMAAGLPVVAPLLSGIPELVEHGTNGLLFPPGDASALAAALRRLLADPALGRRLGAAGRRTVGERFRLDRTVATLLDRLDLEVPPPPATVQALARLAAPDDEAVVGLRRLTEGPDSRVAEVVVSGPEPRELVVKQHRQRPGESAPPVERARRELTVLRHLERALDASDGCSVPHPVGLTADPAALVLELCRGVPLDALLRRLRLRPEAAPQQQLLAAFRGTGRWLARFQQATAEAGQPSPEGIEALLEAARRDLDHLSSRLSRRRVERLRRRLDAPTSLEPVWSLPRVGRHGDFWPGNVFVGPAGVEVIDFEGFGSGLPYDDAAYFLVQAELFLAYPLLRGRFLLLEQAFLDAAFGGGLDRRLLELCRTAAALRLAAGAAGAGRGRRRRCRALLRRAAGRPM
ncbi:MAG TPA: glycosyltransferase [Thermoanaerobaculia bacterium]|nr:glycosyltransferase [Thermoanaerobaculia bacterium]